MRAFLDALDPSDEEHGGAWLATDDEHVLEWNVDGRLVLDVPGRGVRHLAGVSRAQTVDLWCALGRGDLAYIDAQPWRDGNGRVQTPEHRADLERSKLERDRTVYDGLGPERHDARCRREGCTRGPVGHSVLCRVHHFESIMGGPCPFEH